MTIMSYENRSKIRQKLVSLFLGLSLLFNLFAPLTAVFAEDISPPTDNIIKNNNALLKNTVITESTVERQVKVAEQPIDVSAYLSTSIVKTRRVLDLKLLKDLDITSGTLLLKGDAKNPYMTQIIDTSTDKTGTWDILLDDYSGVELLTDTDNLNTFKSITNKEGIENLLPIYINTDVETVDINGNGTPITLRPIVNFSDSISDKVGIVVSGAGSFVQKMSINDLKVSGYAIGDGGSGATAFIGAQLGGEIDKLTLGNFSMTFTNLKLGTLIGACQSSRIHQFEMNGDVNLTGLKSATYSPYVLIGSSGSVIDEMVINETANVKISSFKSGGNSAVDIGAKGTPAPISAFKGLVNGKFRQKNGSSIQILDQSTDNSNIIGGDFQYLDIGGDVDVEITAGFSTFNIIGLCDGKVTMEQLLIRGTANIKANITTDRGTQVVGRGYISVAIGNRGTSGSTAIKELVIENEAQISLSMNAPYQIVDYFGVDSAIGGTQYGSVNKMLIGATYNTQTNSYEVLPDATSQNQPSIRMKNYRALVHGAATINANVYAEMDDADRWIIGSTKGNPTLIGGNYIMKNNGTGILSHIPFTVSKTSSSTGKIDILAKNQYGELLGELLYIDSTESNLFNYHVAAANFGKLPEYDFSVPVSSGQGVEAKYKSIYYPERGLYGRLANPISGGAIAANGILALEFDLPILSSDPINQNCTITISQLNNTFLVPLSDSNLVSFGSNQTNGEPNVLYIYLDKLVSTQGNPIQVGKTASIYAPNNSIQSELYSQDAQLSHLRKLVSCSGIFNVLAKEYAVTFDMNGAASPQIPSQKVSEGDLVQEPTLPTKPYYQFDSWATKDGKTWDFSKDTVQDNMTLFAKWIPNKYTITYEPGAQGDFVTDSHAAIYAEKTPEFAGDKDTNNQPKAKVGYIFDGWNPEVSEVVTTDATYTAQWRAVDYTLSTS